MRQLFNGVELDSSAQHLCFAFNTPCRALSSAVHNGGLRCLDYLLNMKVGLEESVAETPQQSLQNYAAKTGWSGTTVGMMTAASMASCRIALKQVQGVNIAVWATSGLANLRRIGDRAEVQQIGGFSNRIGTINMGLITSACLTDAALAEAMLMMTEAKVAAIYDCDLKAHSQIRLRREPVLILLPSSVPSKALRWNTVVSICYLARYWEV